jgi:DNA-nicking Smr family endonuclease
MTRRPPSRGLPPGDAALWAKVLAEVQPLPGRAAPPAAVSAPEPSPPLAFKAVPPAVARRAANPPALATIEARLARRLARGGAAIDARLDLHGLHQDAAHRRLGSFLAAAQQRGERVVLVITGKGASESEADFLSGRQRGVLRRLVPLWLSEPALRPLVIGFSEAHPSHGGSGALYVRLRKAAR